MDRTQMLLSKPPCSEKGRHCRNVREMNIEGSVIPVSPTDFSAELSKEQRIATMGLDYHRQWRAVVSPGE